VIGTGGGCAIPETKIRTHALILSRLRDSSRAGRSRRGDLNADSPWDRDVSGFARNGENCHQRDRAGDREGDSAKKRDLRADFQAMDSQERL